MNRKQKLEGMRKLADYLCKGLMKEEHAIGAFLFGSIVTGNIHDESDIDLAVVYDLNAMGTRWGKEERRIDGQRVEIWRYSASHFVHTFEDEELRNRPDTWMWASLWVEYMQSCEVLADPTGRLATWQKKARQWTWRRSEVDPVWSQAAKNLESSETCLKKGDSFNSLICLREAMTCLSVAHIMKYNLLPSFRPKELSSRLYQIRDKEGKLLDTFNFLNDITSVSSDLVGELLKPLSTFIDEEWGPERRATRTELENAKSCLRKHDIPGALLSTRYSAYWLGFHILNKRGVRSKPKICDAENHIEMVNNLETAAPRFHDFYRQLHLSEKWSIGKMRAILNQIQIIMRNHA